MPCGIAEALFQCIVRLLKLYVPVHCGIVKTLCPGALCDGRGFMSLCIVGWFRLFMSQCIVGWLKIYVPVHCGIVEAFYVPVHCGIVEALCPSAL